MDIYGQAFFHDKTKVLAHYISSRDVAVISHEDIDDTAAESLIKKQVKAVVNNKCSMTGQFLHDGVKKLLRHGISVYDVVRDRIGSEVNSCHVSLSETTLTIHTRSLEKKRVVKVVPYTLETIQALENKARENNIPAFEQFCRNSLLHAEKDLSEMIQCWHNWKSGDALRQRDILIVVRGSQFEKDLKWVKRHLPSDVSTIAVDGAADSMLEHGILPDFIIGDMDSCSYRSLRCGAQLMVHQNVNGEAPGLLRMKELNLKADTITFVGMSEDAALAFALKEGANNIYLLGGHRDMTEYRSKGRSGMGSSLIMRMFAGGQIIDLKGIHSLENKKHNQKIKDWIGKLHIRFPFTHEKPNKEMRELKA
ncbi:putative cytokinetic ring protein SteA [Alteribacillus iranensis]|uniref:Uncharacterized membrane-anchored protein n=1 Tax=Alteribacillus iranensis TaxID=930128 RepID=A0A1I1ZIG9_9BACI|nr:putative cytokinetic ring protein SteA [Alteribacillus iranensis]SFE31465.1 Uncharacterized membrane-anchored protein [Alteribacillus iranensis]